MADFGGDGQDAAEIVRRLVGRLPARRRVRLGDQSRMPESEPAVEQVGAIGTGNRFGKVVETGAGDEQQTFSQSLRHRCILVALGGLELHRIAAGSGRRGRPTAGGVPIGCPALARRDIIDTTRTDRTVSRGRLARIAGLKKSAKGRSKFDSLPVNSIQ